AFEKSTAIEPGSRNPVWRHMLTFYANSEQSKEEIIRCLNRIAERCSKFGKRSLLSLRARLARWSKYKGDRSGPEADQLIADISSARLAQSRSSQEYYEWLELDAYLDLGRKEELSRRLSELAVSSELSNNWQYLRRKADFLLKFNGDLEGA